ncbi:hypothetical protein DFH08DRAFT_828401 [Mycena albidolilacea]|uniref:Uncharacterized protein n=1 Tax=Mycena albidolilacea TaxID=1033008 RepID=A0AAD6YWC4_9AGAR|nr:hypothetical protein DFH08DRAFT_828401 [Mycena albidolilacea]
MAITFKANTGTINPQPIWMAINLAPRCQKSSGGSHPAARESAAWRCAGGKRTAYNKICWSKGKELIAHLGRREGVARRKESKLEDRNLSLCTGDGLSGRRVFKEDGRIVK